MASGARKVDANGSDGCIRRGWRRCWRPCWKRRNSGLLRRGGFRRAAAVVAVALVPVVSGCAYDDGAFDAGPASPVTGPTLNSTAGNRGTSAGSPNGTDVCANVDVAGNSRNPRLQALLTGAFDDLRCDGSLLEQLRALSDDPAFVVQVRAGGWEKTYRQALGGATLSLVDKDQTTTCMILVVPDPESKSLTCANI